MSKITESARGKECQVRLIGVCNGDSATTVWMHANGFAAAGKGLGMKSFDALGAYGCSACHAVYDRMVPRPHGMSLYEIKLAFWEGHARSLRMLIEAGLVSDKLGGKS